MAESLALNFPPGVGPLGGGDNYISDDFGSLSPLWINGAGDQTTLSVAAGRLTITPTATQKLTDPGLESWFSATNLGSYTEDIAGTSTINQEATNPHGGTYCARLDVDGSSSTCQFRQPMVYTDGIYKAKAWGRGSAGGGEQVIFGPATGSTPQFNTQPFALTTAWQQFKRAFFVTTAASAIFYCSSATDAGLSIYYDDLELDQLTYTSVVALRRVVNPRNLSVAAKVYLGTYQIAGTTLYLDANNWIKALCDGGGNIVLCKNVAGTFSILQTQVITPVSGGIVKLTSDSTFQKFSVYYEGVEMIHNVSIADFAYTGVWYAGMSSSDEATTFDDFATSFAPDT